MSALSLLDYSANCVQLSSSWGEQLLCKRESEKNTKPKKVERIVCDRKSVVISLIQLNKYFSGT